MLQHALMRMWTQAADNAPKRALTLDDYKKVGGLAGALSEHCDEILKEIDAEQQRIAEVMFRALCERSSEQRDTRRPVMLGEVAAIAGVDVEAVKPVVDAFRSAGRNFLMPPLPSPLDAETTLDISHESLIRQWQTLNTWVVAEAESARQYQRLEDAAKRRQQRAGAELWRGVDLANARVWKEHEKPNEAWAARYGDAYQLAMDFLKESEAEEEKQRRENERAHQRELEQARERAEFQRTRAEEQAARAAEQARTASRLKAVTVVIGVLLLVTISVALYAISQRNRAADAQHVAMQAQKRAEEKEKDAVRAAEETERQRIAAVSAAKEADQQRQVAFVRLARYFSAVSKASIEAQPTLSILLSIEALKAALIPAAEEALRDAITKIAGTALLGHTDGVYGAAFSPDGQVLATTSEDKTVRLWALSNPTTEPRVLRGHEGPVWGVAFSPDGQVLATASEDKTVRLWALSNPTAEPRVLRGHEGRVWGVAFSPDGQMLVTASEDSTARLWSLRIDDVVRKACLLTSGNFDYTEWQRYLGDEPYRKTCQNRPLHPSFLEIIRGQIQNGDVEGAVAKLHIALQVDGVSDLALQKEARRLAAPALMEKGRALAKQGAIKEAIADFEAAQASDPNLEIAAAAWNSLCWNGSLGGFATDVMAACERAVALEPDNGGIHDSRGVARALTGDYPGAINDFQQLLEWGPKNVVPEAQIRQRQDWIRMLQANQNPFNEELLKLLRDQ